MEIKFMIILKTTKRKGNIYAFWNHFLNLCTTYATTLIKNQELFSFIKKFLVLD